MDFAEISFDWGNLEVLVKELELFYGGDAALKILPSGARVAEPG